MIRRYDRGETVWNHNKYVLSPSVATVTEVANGQFELELEIPSSQQTYQGDVITAPTPRGLQPFRVYRTVKTLAGKKVYARHIFYDLAKNFLVDVRPTDKTCALALQTILAGTETATSFTGASDIADIHTAYYIRKNPVEAIMGADNSILATWGGYLVRDGLSITVKGAGTDRGFDIRLGKNLIGIEDDSDESNLVTRLYPTAVIDNVVYALPEEYVDSPLIANYPMEYYKTVEVALTDEQRALPIADIYTIMRNYCNSLYSVSNIDKPIANYKVDFVQLANVARIQQDVLYNHDGLSQMEHDTIATLSYNELGTVTSVSTFIDLLEQLDLYDVVHVNVSNLGINLDAQVIKYTYDAIGERFKSIEIGAFNSTAAYQTSNIIRQLESKIANTKTSLQIAIDYATELISGNKGGYVITRKNPDGTPYEILVMDTADINTATNVIRINQDGIG